jgi:hypothetical protein
VELKDKLNLLWKFLFLAVFTFGVISVTCCKKSCSTSCVKQSGEFIYEVAPCGKQLDKQPCGADCVKPCCANK